MTISSVLVAALLCGGVSRLGATYIAQDAAALARDLFTLKARRSVATLTCSDFDSVSLSKALMVRGLWVVQARDHQNVDQARRDAPHKTIGVFLKLDCVAGQRVLEKGAARGLLSRNASWLVWSSSPPKSSLVLRVDSELTWATPEQQPGAVSLSDVYQVAPGWPLTVSRAGRWDQDQGLSYQTRRRNLQGITLKGGTVVTKMATDNLPKRLTSLVNRHVDTISKQNFAITRHMEDIINFTLKLVPVRTWGYLHNGSYGGLIGMMQSGQVQLAMTSLIFKKNRVDAVDYTGPAYRYTSYMMFRHPPALGVRDALLSPFSGGVWLCASLLMTLVVVVLRLITWCEGRQDAGRQGLDSSWSDAAMFAIGTATLQGLAAGSRWLSGRVLVLSAAVMAVFVDAYYAGAIVSSLLLPPPVTIRNLRDLIDSPLAVGLEDLGYNRDYLETSTDPLVRELRRRKTPASYPIEVGVAKLARERFAFQSEVVSLYPLLDRALDERGKCALAEVVFQPHSMTFHAVPKDSPLRELFCRGLRQVWETGLLQYQERRWKPPRPVCSERGKAVSVGLEPLSPAFLLLLGGLLGSLGVLAWERLRFARAVSPAPARETKRD